MPLQHSKNFANVFSSRRLVYFQHVAHPSIENHLIRVRNRRFSEASPCFLECGDQSEEGDILLSLKKDLKSWTWTWIWKQSRLQHQRSACTKASSPSGVLLSIDLLHDRLLDRPPCLQQNLNQFFYGQQDTYNRQSMIVCVWCVAYFAWGQMTRPAWQVAHFTYESFLKTGTTKETVFTFLVLAEVEFVSAVSAGGSVKFLPAV